MFVLKKDHEYDWPVTIQVPIDGGKFDARQITVRFRVMPADDVDKMLGGESLLPPSAEQVKAFLRGVIVGWSEVAVEGGGEAPFNDETLGQLIDLPFARNALFAAYGESVRGRLEKN